jgi:hypothetical protein
MRLGWFPPVARTGRPPAELDQPGLLRVERQRELRKPLSHHVEKPTSLGLAPEADHQIVRTARDDYGDSGLRPTPAFRQRSKT